jgi:hypothetical protein
MTAAEMVAGQGQQPPTAMVAVAAARVDIRGMAEPQALLVPLQRQDQVAVVVVATMGHWLEMIEEAVEAAASAF